MRVLLWYFYWIGRCLHVLVGQKEGRRERERTLASSRCDSRCSEKRQWYSKCLRVPEMSAIPQCVGHSTHLRDGSKTIPSINKQNNFLFEQQLLKLLITGRTWARGNSPRRDEHGAGSLWRNHSDKKCRECGASWHNSKLSILVQEQYLCGWPMKDD